MKKVRQIIEAVRCYFNPKPLGCPPLNMEPAKKADIERDNYIAIARAQTHLLSKKLDELYKREHDIVAERHERGFH